MHLLIYELDLNVFNLFIHILQFTSIKVFKLFKKKLSVVPVHLLNIINKSVKI